MEETPENHTPKNTISPEKLRRRSIRAFVVFGLGIIFTVLLLYALNHQSDEGGIGWAFRKMHIANEKIFGVFFSENHHPKKFNKKDAVKKPRVNGNAGMDTHFKVEEWKLKLVSFENAKDTQFITMDEIKKLPKTDIVFDFKCVEGWSEVTHWGGVKFSDFVRHYKLAAGSKTKYVGMETPDKKYYVGIDMPSAMHPETILCYEMNGKPLPFNQGAPLRLIIPVKYGIKHLKRIGTLFFSNSRPRDYWAERGYDYYAGL